MTVFEPLTTLRFPSTTARNRVERLLTAALTEGAE